MVSRTGRQSRLREKMVRTQEARWAALIGVSLIGLGIAPHVRSAGVRSGDPQSTPPKR